LPTTYLDGKSIICINGRSKLLQARTPEEGVSTTIIFLDTNYKKKKKSDRAKCKSIRGVKKFANFFNKKSVRGRKKDNLCRTLQILFWFMERGEGVLNRRNIEGTDSFYARRVRQGAPVENGGGGGNTP